MYAILQDNNYIALTDNPRYVKQNDNSIWVEASVMDATAIAIAGKLYNYNNYNTIEGAPQVFVREMENGEFFLENLKQSNITFVVLAESGSMDDTTIIEHATAFADWAYPLSYKTGAIRSYNGKLYRCLQDHNSQETWTPEAAPSLWVAIADPAEEYPQWGQPIASTDAYMKGDKVSYNDKHYVSTLDNNVWEPTVYGWEEVVNEREDTTEN